MNKVLGILTLLNCSLYAMEPGGIPLNKGERTGGGKSAQLAQGTSLQAEPGRLDYDETHFTVDPKLYEDLSRILLTTNRLADNQKALLEVLASEISLSREKLKQILSGTSTDGFELLDNMYLSIKDSDLQAAKKNIEYAHDISEEDVGEMPPELSNQIMKGRSEATEKKISEWLEGQYAEIRRKYNAEKARREAESMTTLQHLSAELFNICEGVIAKNNLPKIDIKSLKKLWGGLQGLEGDLSDFEQRELVVKKNLLFIEDRLSAMKELESTPSTNLVQIYMLLAEANERHNDVNRRAAYQSEQLIQLKHDVSKLIGDGDQPASDIAPYKPADFEINTSTERSSSIDIPYDTEDDSQSELFGMISQEDDEEIQSEKHTSQDYSEDDAEDPQPELFDMTPEDQEDEGQFKPLEENVAEFDGAPQDMGALSEGE